MLLILWNISFLTVHSIWGKVEDVCFEKCQQRIRLTAEHALLGYRSPDLNAADVCYINHVMLVAKMCISKFKYGTPLNIECMFEAELRLRKLY